MSVGYIYIRRHSSYDIYNACKLGKASNIPERDNQYATGEIKRGCFELVFEVPIKQLSILERLLQSNFRHFHIQHDAGTEFYHTDIISAIEPYFKSLNISYRKLTTEQITELVRINRIRNIFKQLNKKSLLQTLKTLKPLYKPRDYQTEIIEKSVSYFQDHDKGMLVLICGVGKTLISLWITQRLSSKTVLIGVPNIQLLNQWELIVPNLFPDVPILRVSGGTTNDDIVRFLRCHSQLFLLTTYSSAHKVRKATSDISFIFDMKINDETHHLTTINMDAEELTKTYIEMLNIPSIKQLSLTATLKQLDSKYIHTEVVSNDDAAYFGEIIDRKCLLWAIQNNIICDYHLQTIITNEDDLEEHLRIFNITEENDQRLFLSAYAALKSINDGHSHHQLIYTNSKDSSIKIIRFIILLLEHQYFQIPTLYSSEYHSEMTSSEQTKCIQQFETAPFGILSCVYCLGEGWDFPLLDAVVFAENMTSNIRIVQSALRASRKDEKSKHKIAKIILPILYRDDWLEDTNNQDLKKVRKVIHQMGQEDETISQKVKVYKIKFEKHLPLPKEQMRPRLDEFGEYDDALTQQLRLKTIPRIALGMTYDKARKIISEKSIRSKQAYYELCEHDARLPREPEEFFKGKFTNWIHYLSIEGEYYDLEICRRKVNEYLQLHPELRRNIDMSNICTILCEQDPLFPPNGLWVEYYNIKNVEEIMLYKPSKRKVISVL